jgi:hypothetical protein
LKIIRQGTTGEECDGFISFVGQVHRRLVKFVKTKLK